MTRPVCHVVAGPNGSGKSTFALDYLPEFAGSIEYVNPDLLAQGLSPTDITLSALKAGKLTLRRIAALIGRRVPFGDYARVSDMLRVFDASGLKQELIYVRNGRPVSYGTSVRAMRKDLGI